MFFTSVSCVSNPVLASGFVSPPLYIKTEACLLCDSSPYLLTFVPVLSLSVPGLYALQWHKACSGCYNNYSAATKY